MSAPRPQQRSVAIVPAASLGVDPVVGEHVTARARVTTREMGYSLSSEEAVEAARAQIQPSSPPSPADLWRMTFVAGAERGIAARVWANRGRYVVEVVVASLDGTGPFRAVDTASAETLHEVVARLVRELLPPPSAWDEEAAARFRSRAEEPSRPRPTPAAPSPIAASRRRPSRRGTMREPPTRRFSVALQTEAAIGASEETFYNHLIGGRLDLRITRAIIIGAYFGYANLNGRNGRAHNIVSYLHLEDRIDVVGVEGLTVPIRAGAGYVPFNGPIIRIAAGMNYAFSERWEAGIDLLAPTFWFTADGRPVTFDVGIEIIYRLGRAHREAARTEPEDAHAAP